MFNPKRAVGFGVMLWILIFVLISILMFTPWFKDSEMRIQIAWWVLEIPMVLLLAKWYFRVVEPTIKKGFLLGLTALVVGNILDLIITIPLFVSQQSEQPYLEYYADWKMWFGFVLLLALTTFAGFEFDGTFTKKEELETKSE